MCRPELERQIHCFPYGERSDGTQLQQVEQKAVGRQRNLGLCGHMLLLTPGVNTEIWASSYIYQLHIIDAYSFYKEKL